MTAVLQRAARAAVTVAGETVGAVGEGLLVLLGVAEGDDERDAELLAAKIAACRIFCDEEGRMNRSVLDVGGGVLIVSNFTLLANYRHGNRPDYFGAAAPETAEKLYDYFCAEMRERGLPVATGRFGADMQIDLLADGPVTIVMESAVLRKKGEKT